MKTSKPLRRRHALAALAAFMAPAWPARAAAAEAPLRLGTSTAGGGFALYGETLERLVNAQAGRELLRTRRTRGTAENLVLLQQGELDAALIQGTAASEVLQQGPASGLRVLWAMYPSPGMLAVPAASPARRLEDLKGRRVVFGVRSSGLVTLARQVFDGLGLDIDRDFDAVYVAQAADSPRLVISGEAAGLWGAGEGWPGFVAVAQAPGGARFLGPAPAQMPQILAKYPLLQAMTVPAGLYPGIDAPLPTVGSVNLILARADLDLARARAFVQAAQAVAVPWVAALPQAAFSTLANTRASAPSAELLHPALR
jgi:uncharacterized protein